MATMLSNGEMTILHLIPFERRDKRMTIDESDISVFPKEEVHQIINSLWEKQLIGRMNGSGWYRPVIGMGTPRVETGLEPKPNIYVPQGNHTHFEEREIIQALGSPGALKSGLTMRELMESCPSGSTVTRGTVYNRLYLLQEHGLLKTKTVKRIEEAHHNKSKRGKDFTQRRVLHVKAYFLVNQPK